MKPGSVNAQTSLVLETGGHACVCSSMGNGSPQQHNQQHNQQWGGCIAYPASGYHRQAAHPKCCQLPSLRDMQRQRGSIQPSVAGTHQRADGATEQSAAVRERQRRAEQVRSRCGSGRRRAPNAKSGPIHLALMAAPLPMSDHRPTSALRPTSGRRPATSHHLLGNGPILSPRSKGRKIAPEHRIPNTTRATARATEARGRAHGPVRVVRVQITPPIRTPTLTAPELAPSIDVDAAPVVFGALIGLPSKRKPAPTNGLASLISSSLESPSSCPRWGRGKVKRRRSSGRDCEREEGSQPGGRERHQRHPLVSRHRMGASSA